MSASSTTPSYTLPGGERWPASSRVGSLLAIGASLLALAALVLGTLLCTGVVSLPDRGIELGPDSTSSTPVQRAPELVSIPSAAVTR